ncbi:MAG: RNA polymerase sigma factor RpoH [Gammaproteobacteria bacterium]|nr:RNA polymerase sigma factor RpoH [Gammaproteobacteria bacterium]MCY3816841.1 RNA polymerase sigma factor RpoH [Gammaproteobacteria bacterium]MXW19257.1 RNA polymerase sigma factor RpoH [Gammaproteobacteria bacterium]MXZ27831.1 RNA polymerase sigma factor RpoH [Gammaproteobacteria bacterium]MYH34654.1 RNA polymerase sigma factor RpoH [Gammaproteobacteria bacterium]
MNTAIAATNRDLILAGPLGSLDAYIQAVGSVPSLSQEEERELATRLREDGDLDAARQLVLAHLRFVVHIASRYQGYGLPMADLIQEGNVGLMKAVKRFDPEVGVRLVTFAVHWIRAEIHEFILRNWRLVKVATTKAQRKLFFNLRKLKKRLGWMSPDEQEAVAEYLGVKPEEVAEMEMRLAGQDITFDPPTSDSEEQTYSPSQYLPSSDLDPAAELEEADAMERASEQLAEALAGLDERSRDIITSRRLVEKKTTLHELAGRYGVSAERIRQIENQALKQLSSAITAP